MTLATAIDFAEDWAALETHVTADGTFAPPTRTARGIDAKIVKFPCQACNGTGVYRGARVHQSKAHCFACKGQGYFLTSERDRQAARQTAATSKARKLDDARAVFDAANPGLAAFVASAAKWSGFAANMVAALAQYGALTDGQTAAVRKMQATCAANAAKRQAERASAQERQRCYRAATPQGNATVDLSAIRAMFETAVGSGYKKPVYRAADLIISRAPSTGKNPGALYVKTVSDEYLGKIIGTQYTGKPATGLAAIAADPKGEAVRYGQRTGSCSCCGRKLTVHASIEAGIGPICAEKWGL